MRDLHMKLSIVDFLSITAVEIHKKVNEHGYAKIIGMITSNEESKLIQKVETETYAVLSISDENNTEKNIFAGIIEQIEIENTGGVKIAEIWLRGATRLMEGILHTHTYQDAGMSYEQILDGIHASYAKSMYLQNCGKGAVIGDMVVQYKENDWEFVKRLASHFNQPIIPNYGGEGIRYFFGLCNYGNGSVLNEIAYKVGNDKEDFFVRKENAVRDISVQDFLFYEVKSREYFELGDKVIFQGKTLYVYEAEGKLEGGELLHNYILRPEGGFRVEKQYNMKIIGASLDAEILAIQNDTVKVCVKEDGMQEESTAKWFPYSTVYSSPDGTGWYCMPEAGDKVRLYFPNEKEEEGYIISSINLGNTGENTSGAGGNTGAPAPRSNPDNKSISNKYNKQIELTPTSITITNNKGMSIIMDDAKGIDIVSDKEITILSEESLSVVSLNSKVNVEAIDAIELVQGNSKITMKDDVTIEGAKLNVQ